VSSPYATTFFRAWATRLCRFAQGGAGGTQRRPRALDLASALTAPGGPPATVVGLWKELGL